MKCHQDRSIAGLPVPFCPFQDPFSLLKVPPGFPSTEIGGTDGSSWPLRSLTQQGHCSAALVLVIYLVIYLFLFLF